MIKLNKIDLVTYLLRSFWSGLSDMPVHTVIQLKPENDSICIHASQLLTSLRKPRSLARAFAAR